MSSACCALHLQLFNFLNFVINVISEIKMTKISANTVCSYNIIIYIILYMYLCVARILGICFLATYMSHAQCCDMLSADMSSAVV